ncbi:MAG: carbohydrate ABC transporter substrate-binding protein [bacterium]|nr:carbohydrate ABC transporter substrate-binding protein [bacterium]
MKYLFAVVLAVLIVLSVGTYLSFPSARTEVPILYWVTDPNPARHEQIALFHQWLIKNDLGEEVVIRTAADANAFLARDWSPAMETAIRSGNPDAEQIWDPTKRNLDAPVTLRVPLYEMRVDTSNRDESKMIIQGVSGVGGDIMDLNTGSGVRFFQSVGLLADVTEAGKSLRFDPPYTFEAMAPELTIDGRQYAFPCNVALGMFWVNKTTFRDHGQPLPPDRWTFDEFERRGKAFVEAANRSGARQRVFYADRMDLPVMRRSLGLSMFNETLTKCTLDDPRFAQCLELLYKWTYEDRILPTLAEQESFDTQTGYGGAVMQIFNQGNYAMFLMGRYALIQLRRFGELELAVVELPNGGFPNVYTTTRAAGVYSGGDHRDLAVYFLSYLASEDYNMQLVRDADALPPNPAFAETEAFLRPEEFPNEWECHEAFITAENSIAIGGAYSPFVLDSIAIRHRDEAFDAHMNDLMTAAEAGDQVTARINAEIRRTLQETPVLKPLFEERTALQDKIDARRAEGRPVPVDWIKNPFYRRYYAEQGWIAEEGTE